MGRTEATTNLVRRNLWNLLVLAQQRARARAAHTKRKAAHALVHNTQQRTRNTRRTLAENSRKVVGRNRKTQNTIPFHRSRLNGTACSETYCHPISLSHWWV